MNRPMTTDGHAALRCIKCARLLLCGMFVGVLRCPSCKTDNRRTLDDFLQWIHNVRQNGPLQGIVVRETGCGRD